ncbi:hypothetical protein BDF22DRAFT_687663 [Syncephalis plumigaleata]|nr:hypothetical protein BDF22DRAFT_687663 [Syncephalis plumigaleata]
MTPAVQNKSCNTPSNSNGKSDTEQKNDLLRVTRRLNAWFEQQQQQPGRRIVVAPRNWLLQWLQRHIITRMAGMERLFVLNPLARLLVYLGFSPVHIFIATSFGTAVGLRWLYRESRGLFLTLAGIVYPVCSTWRLLRVPINPNNPNDADADAVAIHKWTSETRRWLAYWAVFAILQLTEHWNKRIQDRFAAYHPLKLLLLYWLQCPVARGAVRFANLGRKFKYNKPNSDVTITVSSVSTDTQQITENNETVVNESIASTSTTSHNVYAHNGDDWDVFKQRLSHELTSRSSWQNPQSVFDDTSTIQLSTYTIDYAGAMQEDQPFSTHYSTSELFT